MTVRRSGAASVLAVASIALSSTYCWSTAGAVDPRPNAGKSSFAETVLQWNGDIFWAPAAQTENAVTKFGDEARAVFGAIPDVDCSDRGAKVLPIEVDGNIVDLKPNPGKAGAPLEFEHRDAIGAVVKWTDSVPKCDKPSLAGNVTYCGLNSRLGRVVRGNVDWLFLCRKSLDRDLTRDPYWRASNPEFALLGIIGFNGKTGEIVYFDGRKDRASFDWSRPFIPPGGHSYADASGRAAAEAIYDPTFEVRCYACHDNKSALVVDPRAGQARVGYFGGTTDRAAIAFSLGDYLPLESHRPTGPFRVIGSGYTRKYSGDLESARVVRDPTGNCTGCHTLTTQITGRRFAADAVAQEPWISTPTWGQALQLRDEKIKFASVMAHRTDWALRSGAGKIHPWMVPGDGNELALLAPEMSGADWRQLSNCLWHAGGAECGYSPLYTACPAPESAPPGDPAAPTGIAAEVPSSTGYDLGADRVVRVRWRYRNDYGAVPQRDDVRFNVAVREAAIPAKGGTPAASDYPSLAEAIGKNFEPLAGAIGVSGSAILIENASYAGHTKWTDPAASEVPREYQIDFPGACNRRYLIRIVPKRFCFDQSDIKYSAVDHILFVDVRCS